MITLAAFVIMVCTGAEPCRALAMPYETLTECKTGITDLTAMWSENIEKMLIPKMHCERKPENT